MVRPLDFIYFANSTFETRHFSDLCQINIAKKYRKNFFRKLGHSKIHASIRIFYAIKSEGTIPLSDWPLT